MKTESGDLCCYLSLLHVLLAVAYWLIVEVVTVCRGGDRALFGLRGMLLPLACCCLPRACSSLLRPKTAGHRPGRLGGTVGPLLDLPGALFEHSRFIRILPLPRIGALFEYRSFRISPLYLNFACTPRSAVKQSQNEPNGARAMTHRTPEGEVIRPETPEMT